MTVLRSGISAGHAYANTARARSVGVSAVHDDVGTNSSPKVGSFNKVIHSQGILFFSRFLCFFEVGVDGVGWFVAFLILQLIESLISREDLSEADAEASLDFLLKDADEALISAFLVLLRAKGETFEEVRVPRSCFWGVLCCCLW